MPTLTANTTPRVASERELLVFLIDDDAAKINQATTAFVRTTSHIATTTIPCTHVSVAATNQRLIH